MNLFRPRAVLIINLTQIIIIIIASSFNVAQFIESNASHQHSQQSNNCSTNSNTKSQIDDTKDDPNSIIHSNITAYNNSKLNGKLSAKLEQPQTSSILSILNGNFNDIRKQIAPTPPTSASPSSSKVFPTITTTKSEGFVGARNAKEKLIYEIAIKYKQIFRLSLISCRHKATHPSASSPSSSQSAASPSPSASASEIKFERMQTISKSILNSSSLSWLAALSTGLKAKHFNNYNSSNTNNSNNNDNNAERQTIRKDTAQPGSEMRDDNTNEMCSNDADHNQLRRSAPKHYDSTAATATATILRFFFAQKHHYHNYKSNINKIDCNCNHCDEDEEKRLTHQQRQKNCHVVECNCKKDSDAKKMRQQTTTTTNKLHQHHLMNEENYADSILIKVISVETISNTLSSSSASSLYSTAAAATASINSTLSIRRCRTNQTDDECSIQNRRIECSNNNHQTTTTTTTRTDPSSSSTSNLAAINVNGDASSRSISIDSSQHATDDDTDDTQTVVTARANSNQNIDAAQHNNFSEELLSNANTADCDFDYSSLHNFGSANRTLFDAISQHENFHQVIVLDLMTCGECSSKRILRLASELKLFTSSNHWILIDDRPASSSFNRSASTPQSNTEASMLCDGKPNLCGQLQRHSDATIPTPVHTKAFIDAKQFLSNETNTVYEPFSSSALPTPARSASINSVNNNHQNDANFHCQIKTTTTSSSKAKPNQYKQDMPFIESFLSKLNININTELTLVRRRRRRRQQLEQSEPPQEQCKDDINIKNQNKIDSNPRDYYQLFDVWSPGYSYGGKLNITQIGTYSDGNGGAGRGGGGGLKLFKWYRSQATIARRMNMSGVSIRSMIVTTKNDQNQSLIEYLESTEHTHLDSMNHFGYALLKYVRDMFDFRLNLTNTNSWGYFVNGSYDGMIGALIRNETDIGGSPIYFRLERAKVIHYTLEKTWISRPCFIFRHPKNWNPRGIIFLQPFQTTVWITIALCCIVTIAIGWILSYIEQTLWHCIQPKSDRYDNEDKIFCSKTRQNYWNIIGKIQQTYLQQQPEKFDLKSSTIVAGTKQHFQPKSNSINDSKDPFMSRSYWSSTSPKRNEKFPKINFFDFIVFVIGMLCLQGVPATTRLLSGRIVIVCLLLFSFIIYQYYSASIVGTLLTEQSKTIRTLPDLINSDLNLGIEDIVYNKDFFRRTTDPDAIELYQKLNELYDYKNDSGLEPLSPHQLSKRYRKKYGVSEKQKQKQQRHSAWLSADIGLKLVKSGGYAFHVDVSTAYKIIAEIFGESEVCELSEIQLFPPQIMVNIVQRNSPLRKLMMYGLRRVSETGLMDYQRKVWNYHKPHCTKTIEPSDLSVDMQTFLSAFFILLFGIASSIIMLTIEILFNRITTRGCCCLPFCCSNKRFC